jgi:hypothetical protein
MVDRSRAGLISSGLRGECFMRPGLPLTVLMTFFLFCGSAISQCVPQTRQLETYSIIRDSPGLSGPAGIELSIELQATNVQGRLHDPEGTSSPLETKLAGTLKDGELHRVGQNRPGRVESQEKMYVASFRGTIRAGSTGKSFPRELSSNARFSSTKIASRPCRARLNLNRRTPEMLLLQRLPARDSLCSTWTLNRGPLPRH